VKVHVYPERKDNNRKAYRERWWIHAEARPSMRKAISKLQRFIVTPHVSKHRLFVWLQSGTIPDHQLIVVTRDDDYFFGVLHARPHELWALRMGTALEDRPRYTPTTTFETYPFPWPPGQELPDDPKVQAIAAAARKLVELRENWLNPTPSGLAATSPKSGAPQPDLGEAGRGSRRTLTSLYNQRPTWLANAHRQLDAAVFAAYGWPDGLSDEEILERLLALNWSGPTGSARCQVCPASVETDACSSKTRPAVANRRSRFAMTSRRFSTGGGALCQRRQDIRHRGCQQGNAQKEIQPFP
jgi:type II restriction/modification system DNA methylase subunit YeeA